MTITKLFKFQFQRNYKEIYRFLIITKFKFSFNLPRNKFFLYQKNLKNSRSSKNKNKSSYHLNFSKLKK